MSCCGSSALAQDVALRNLQRNAENDKQRDILSTSNLVGEGLVQTDFVIPAMHCGGCISSIERAIKKLDFVDTVRANLSLKRVSVIWQKDTGNLQAIDQTLTDLGFEHSLFDVENDDSGDQKQAGRKLLMALGVAGFGAANIMLLSVSIWSGADPETITLFHLLSGIIAVPVVAFAGKPFFYSALTALKAGRLNMDVPISLAVLLALVMSIYESLSGGKEAYFDAAVTLLFFLLIGRYLDHLMRDKARDAVRQLNRIASKGASLVLDDNNLQYLTINQITPGQILRIFAGERFPVDGKIIKGSSDLDCSLVTGENLPVQSGVGENVEAGTLNLTGVIDIRVLRDAKHSFLAEVARMMEAAEKGRGRFTRIADRMAQIYAPAVHLLAALAFVGWMVATAGDWHTSIYVAISVLIITCPCALGLAVPVAHVIASRQLFKQGIIITDGAGFERMEQVTRVIFDKTGTLTTGIPKIGASSPMSSTQKSIAVTLGANSNHPASKAVEEYLKNQTKVALTNIHEIPGFGIEASYNEKRVRLGRAEWVAEITKSKPGKSEEGLGFGIENDKISTFQLTEELREGVVSAIEALRSTGIKIELMSGDNEKSVREIAGKLDILEFHFRQTPSDKLSYINELHADGEKVLMVGDGLNDAPALTGAHVSIAPSNACDVGRQASDFVFTHKSLMSVPFALKTSHRAGMIVRQNFTMAILYNIIAIPFAIAGFVTPLIAAIAMSASSIVVVGNSMRLSKESKRSE